MARPDRRLRIRSRPRADWCGTVASVMVEFVVPSGAHTRDDEE
jgi:hypothetical protein